MNARPFQGEQLLGFRRALGLPTLFGLEELAKLALAITSYLEELLDQFDSLLFRVRPK